MVNFTANISKLVASRGLSYALGFVATPIVARLYLPEHFGVYGLVIAITAWVSCFSSLNYWQAIPLTENRAEAATVAKLCLWISLPLILIVALVFGVGGDLVARLLREPDIAPYLWFVPLLFMVDSLSNIVDSALIGERRFGTISALVFVVANLERLITILWAMALGAGTMGLLIGNIIGVGLGALIAAVIVSTIFYGKSPRKDYQRVSLKEVAKKYKQFPTIHMWSSLLRVSTNRSPFLILMLFFGPAALGYFAFARNIATMPMKLFGASVSQVFYPEAAQEWRESGAVTVSIEKAVKITSKMMAFPLLTTGLLAPLFFEILFGARWYEAGILAQFLTILIFANIITDPISKVFLIANKAHHLLWYAAVQLLVSLATVSLGSWLTSLRLTVALFSIGGFLIYSHMFISCMRLGKANTKVAIKNLALESLIALIALAPTVLLYYLSHCNWLCLILYDISTVSYGLVMLKREPVLREKIQHFLIKHKFLTPSD